MVEACFLGSGIANAEKHSFEAVCAYNVTARYAETDTVVVSECVGVTMQSVDSASSSDSDSTEEEERLRQLFSSCDRDGDGYIDRCA